MQRRTDSSPDRKSLLHIYRRSLKLNLLRGVLDINKSNPLNLSIGRRSPVVNRREIYEIGMNIVKDYDGKNERNVRSADRSVFPPFAPNAGKRITTR